MKARCLYCENERNISYLEKVIIEFFIKISNLITDTNYNFLFYVDDNATCCEKPFYLWVKNERRI